MNKLEESSKVHEDSKVLMVVLGIVMVLFAIYGSSYSISAGDTWIAMACGRHMVDHGVTNVDPFSFNSHTPGPTPAQLERYPSWMRSTVARWCPDGWVNQNWLAHLIFYGLAQNLGYNSLIAWKLATYILVVFMLYAMARIMGSHPIPAAGFACFAMFISRSFLDIRPQGFTNFCVVLFLLILVLTTYRNVRYIWLVVPEMIFWANVHGGFIYVFIVSVPFVLVHLALSKSKERFVTIGKRGVVHVVGAVFAALVVSIVFNPYHVTNLTHTFVISVSKDAELWRNVAEWFSPFDFDIRFGSLTPFFIMLGILGVLLLVWAIALFLKPNISRKAAKKLKPQEMDYSWPKVDLAMLTVGLLTIYMAVRSRRFIPIAAMAGCPLMAVLLDQTVRMILAKIQFVRHNQLSVPSMSPRLRKGIVLACAGLTLGFGFYFGSIIKSEFYDANPNYIQPDTFFMRMTSSYDKPFGAGYFIRENKIRGRILAPWTEGGFVIWSQDPDPVSGRIPLPVFIDGRAQAAYPSEKFVQYLDTVACKGAGVNIGGQGFTESQVSTVAQWLDSELKKDEVSVIMISIRRFEPAIFLMSRPNWRAVYVDERYMLLVNIDDANHRALYETLEKDQAKFPDEFSRKITRAFTLVRTNDLKAKEAGVKMAREALAIRPCTVALQQILFASQHAEFSSQARAVCQEYLADYKKNRSTYNRQNGYTFRFETAQLAQQFLNR